MRRVLITGAAGFLGRHFVQYHLTAGDFIYAIDDMSAAHAHKVIDIDRILWWAEDIGSALRRPSFFDQVFDVAYHFASPVGGRLKIEYDPFFNMDAFRQDSEFFRWAAKAKPKRVVYPSSSAVYPVVHQTKEKRDHLDVSLVDVTRPQMSSGLPDATYGFTKLAGEHMAYTLSKSEVEVLVLRPFSGYGPGQPADYPMTAIIQRALRREDPLIVWGTGEQIRDFVYVDDIVKAAIDPSSWSSMGHTDFRVRNVGTARGTSFIHLARKVADMVGYRPEIATYIDKPVGVFFRVAMPTVRDWQYLPLEDGLQKTIAYYKERQDEWDSPLHA